jgi:ribosomal protein S18 acetylase RimI-like enzyme
MTIVVEPLNESNFDKWLEFYDSRALKDNPEWDGCYCQFYFDNESEESSDLRNAACERFANKGMEGFVALSEEKVIGWMAAGPSSLYLKLPFPAPEIARVVCFTIQPEFRGQGIAKALLSFGIENLRARGFKTLEGRGVYETPRESTNYPGPKRLYESLGFKEIMKLSEDFALMRLELQ